MASLKRNLAFAVAVAALGYFVDLYDIVLFGVVRVASLTDLGVQGADLTTWGVRLLNLQMIGMLVGGFAWGVIGDRYGRRFALLSTISVYSLANIANAAITSVEQYALLRLLAGFGLAGELGAGVTLVSELLPKQLRGYGTTVISFLGLVGALAASYVGAEFNWRVSYIIGGGLGLMVLGGRYLGLAESKLFNERAAAEHGGELERLLGSGVRLRRFLAVIALGVPIWYVSALFVNFAPEYGRALGFAAPLTVAEVLRTQALGLAIGSALSGLASEWLRSRRCVLLLCFVALATGVAALLQLHDGAQYVELMFAIGLAQGYWTAFITLAAEQFGTDLRATVTTSAPNIVRAMTVPVTLSVQALAGSLGFIGATYAVGALVFAGAFLALARVRETWGTELNYTER
jgi:MFS family permease